jgi:hypothetical protein
MFSCHSRYEHSSQWGGVKRLGRGGGERTREGRARRRGKVGKDDRGGGGEGAGRGQEYQGEEGEEDR